MDADELSARVGTDIESLIEDFGYSRSDVLDIVNNALENQSLDNCG